MKSTRLIFRPFHWFDQNERSTVTVGYLVIAMTLYVTVAGIFNTGVVVDQKIRTQAIADAAAHGTATRIAAAINEMAMLNLLALRAQAALTVYDSYERVAWPTAIIAGIAAAVFWVLFAISCFALSPNASLARQAVQLTLDTISLGLWIDKFSQADKGALEDVFDQTTARQQRLKSELANDIQSQITGLKKHLDDSGNTATNIYVSHPDITFYPTAGGSNSYIFEDSSRLTKTLMLASRVIFADAQWLTADSITSPPDSEVSWKFPVLRSHKFFDIFEHKITKIALRIALYVSLGIHIAIYAGNDWGIDLKSSDRQIMQVIAVAERTESDKTFMARGFFKQLNNNDGQYSTVLAVAQAEASNVYGETVQALVGSTLDFIPWEMWTTLGPNYQGRLSRVDWEVVNDALGQNNDMANAWEVNTGSRSVDRTQVLSDLDREAIFLH